MLGLFLKPPELDLVQVNSDLWDLWVFKSFANVPLDSYSYFSTRVAKVMIVMILAGALHHSELMFSVMPRLRKWKHIQKPRTDTLRCWAWNIHPPVRLAGVFYYVCLFSKWSQGLRRDISLLSYALFLNRCGRGQPDSLANCICKWTFAPN